MRLYLVPLFAITTLACGDDATPGRPDAAVEIRDANNDTQPDTAPPRDTTPVETTQTPDTTQPDTAPPRDTTTPDTTEVVDPGTCRPITLSAGLLFSEDSTPDDGYSAFFTDVDGDLGFGTALGDELWIEFFDTESSTIADTGTFDLGSGDNANYDSCAQCVTVYGDIDGQNYGFDLFQASGTLRVDPATPPSESVLTATVTDLKLIVVTIDPESFTSTPVAGAPCYIINGPVTLKTE